MTVSIKFPAVTMVLRFALGMYLMFSGGGMLYLALSGGLADVEQLAGPGGDFMRAVIHTGYLWQFLGLFKLTAGVLMLIPKTAKLAVIATLPYAINIGLWSIFYATEYVALGLVVLVLSIYLVYAYFDVYRPIVKMN